VPSADDAATKITAHGGTIVVPIGTYAWALTSSVRGRGEPVVEMYAALAE